jgi:hypothetical protein
MKLERFFTGRKRQNLSPAERPTTALLLSQHACAATLARNRAGMLPNQEAIIALLHLSS